MLLASLAALLLQDGMFAPPPPPPHPALKIVRQPDAARYYPKRERKEGRDGTVKLGLDLRYDGVVTGCRVERSSGSSALDAAACKLGRELRFEEMNVRGGLPKAWRANEYGCCMRVQVAFADGTARVHKLVPPRPATVVNPLKVISSSDYPHEAIRAGLQGTVAVSLGATAEGRITGCEVTESSGSPVLDQATCRLVVERATVVPARDEFGEPVAGSATFRTRWQLAPTG